MESSASTSWRQPNPKLEPAALSMSAFPTRSNVRKWRGAAANLKGSAAGDVQAVGAQSGGLESMAATTVRREALAWFTV